MSQLEPFSWMVVGLIIAMGYVFLSVPRHPRPAQCVGWGVTLGVAGGVLGHVIAIGMQVANPPAVALTLSAMGAIFAMAALTTKRWRPRRQ